MVQDSDSDPLLEELLNAARRETPSPRVKERALLNASRPKVVPGRGKWLLAALVIGGIGFAVGFGSDAPPADISAERGYARAREPSPAESAVEAPEEPPSAPEPPSVAAQKKPVLKPTPLTLEAELTLLDQARKTLVQGSAEQALVELDAYERRATARRLGAEASLLRIQILAASGRSEEASALARKFVIDHPGSPLAERAKSFANNQVQVIRKEEGAHP
jgi:hypothetical protein